MSSKKTKKIDKGLNDADWSGQNSWTSDSSGGTMTVAGISAINASLNPSEAYNLSVDARSCISAIAQPVSRCKPRFFLRRSGDEIIDGEIVRKFRHPMPKVSFSQYIYELVSWRNLAGEMIVGALRTEDNKLAGLRVLNPFKMRIMEPVPAVELYEVKKWQYITARYVIDYNASEVVFYKNFNPFSNVRGSSPILAGCNLISADFYATKYCKNYFVNNAEPSHIVILPPETTEKQRDTFREEYIAHHSSYTDQTHKIWVVVAGKEFDIKTISDTTNEKLGILNESLMKMAAMKSSQLWHVPPVMLGALGDQVKYDSADVQREVFLSDTLMPEIELQTAYQQQIINQYYGNNVGDIVRDKKPQINKQIKSRFEQAMDEAGPDSDVVFLLDPTSLEIVNLLKKHRLDYAQEYQATFKVSPIDTAKHLDIDIPENAQNRKIWVSSKEVGLDPEQETETLTPLESTEDNTQQEVVEPKSLTEVQKLEVHRLVGFYRNLRKLALDSMDQGRLFKLAEADALLKDLTIAKEKASIETRNIIRELYPLIKKEKDIEAKKLIIKDVFRPRNKSFYKTIVR